MREAIRLAIESVEKDGGPFGAVIVHDRNIVGRGANCVTAANDPTAHAEIVAIRQACANLDTFLLDDCECYATAEPCPMCLGALYWARIPRVYYGCSSRDAQDIGFDDTRIYRELCIPIPQRDIRMHQMLRKEALSAFRLWREKSDKIPY
ncbi:MAG: nucleoside deaminase [Candidatus Pacebacteria bacterium]|nr:nucleoside deaminase [Candidatus Paceibacterota bacterium]